MVNSNRIGNQLKAYRKSKNMTTQELADKVSISQSYVSRFENGRAIPDIDLLEKMLIALDTNLANFFAGDEGLPEDLIQLIDTLKTLSPDARKKLNEFLQLMKD